MEMATKNKRTRTSNQRFERREVCIGCWQALLTHNKQVCRRARRVAGRLCLGFCKRKWVTK